MMKRRELLGALAAIGALRPWNRDRTADDAPRVRFDSAWHEWPDMRWIGPAYWANRLQDWRLSGGHAECLVRGRNRTVHCLTHRVAAATTTFATRVHVTRTSAHPLGRAADLVGFRLGATGPNNDYRSAAVYGTGLDVGLTGDHRLRIGTVTGDTTLPSTPSMQLEATVTTAGAGTRVMLAARSSSGDILGSLSVADLAAGVVGNIALLCHVDEPENSSPDDEPDQPVARFSTWQIDGDALLEDDTATFGPVCFSQYTLHRGIVKLTAQLTPIESARSHSVHVDVRDGTSWHSHGPLTVDPLSRTVQLRLAGWDGSRAVPYRVRVELPVGGVLKSFVYEGTIAAEPTQRDRLAVACFSCNADHGFPDADVVAHASVHKADAVVFLGDQFYESHGGFGIQRAPLAKASLDMLRKWYMFGWSYRDLFRHVPSAMIPDDHDVYHGNIWGEGGTVAPTDKGWGYVAQDQGGYKMPAAWVNVVQRAQTSHLPDPVDPTPVSQNIGVYFTQWDYAGVSFAILEDRKFKSAPSHFLPPSARVVNGFATDPAFRHDLQPAYPGAQLLGDRQERFLASWAADARGAAFKVVLSQTPFCAANTLPAGSTSDEAVPTLAIPEPREYVAGDAPAADMDTNGWPVERRDLAVRLLRQAGAFHIAGDQHLGSFIQYGVSEFADAGFVFTVPALNNIWPRRWFPTLDADHRPLRGAAAYTGDFRDAFGNRMTVHAAANPRRTGRLPAIIHDRATGYGLVVFNKGAGTIRVECWPRGVNPVREPTGQYEGWPITIRREGERWVRG